MSLTLPPKKNILGVLISATDYAQVTRCVIDAAQSRRSMSVSACAVHGLMEAHLDPVFGAALNEFEIVAPDGQPVRWSLSWTKQAHLEDRVYGPNLTLKVCEAAAQAGVPVFFFGSAPETLKLLSDNLTRQFPSLKIAGTQPSRFREATPEEAAQDAQTIEASGAQIVFVGLGCPRQEWWAYHQRKRLNMPTLAVGAAFDFHAGTLPQAPGWMQRAGLEWAFRLSKEPVRLFRRYVRLNPIFLYRISQQMRNPIRFTPASDTSESASRPCPG